MTAMFTMSGESYDSLDHYYREKIVPHMQETFGYRNQMEIPRLKKVTVNMGLGAAVANKKLIPEAVEQLASMTGQQPIVTKTRKAIAGFKIREDWPIGCKVTLRRSQMERFLQKLVFVVLPAVRDFRGLSKKSFDGQGNYNLGLREQIVFPEIDYEQIENTFGMDIAITTSARTDEEAAELLGQFFFPFKEKFIGE